MAQAAHASQLAREAAARFAACMKTDGPKRCAEKAMETKSAVPCEHQDSVTLSSKQKLEQCDAYCQTDKRCKNTASSRLTVESSLKVFITNYLNRTLNDEPKVRSCCFYCDIHWNMLLTRLEPRIHGVVITRGEHLAQLAMDNYPLDEHYSANPVSGACVRKYHADEYPCVDDDDIHHLMPEVRKIERRNAKRAKARYGACDDDPNGGPATGNTYDRLFKPCARLTTSTGVQEWRY
jgi:hypothetical protein